LAFQCNVCSYQGKQFAGGACPACGSYNATSKRKADPAPTRARTPFRLALMVALWGFWLLVIYQKFFGA
jgi:predicted ATP-dependent serine protease